MLGYVRVSDRNSIHIQVCHSFNHLNISVPVGDVDALAPVVAVVVDVAVVRSYPAVEEEAVALPFLFL